MKTYKKLAFAVVLITQFLVFKNTVAKQNVDPGLKDRFLEFATVQSVTGRETGFTDFLKTQIPEGLTVQTDNFGNLIVKIGEGDPEVLFVTSVDEPGYVVSKISDNGILNVQFPSGRAPSTLFHQFHEGHLVDIKTENGILKGIVVIPSTHIFRGQKPNLTVDKFLIDIGAGSKEEAENMGVKVLDTVSAIKDIASLSSNRLAGPMLSRKFGAFALMETLKGLDLSNQKSIVFAWTTQGYRRTSGASRLAQQFNPRLVVVVQGFTSLTGRGRQAEPTQHPVTVLDSGILTNYNAQNQTGAEVILSIFAAASFKGIKTAYSITGNLTEISSFRQSGAEILPASIPVRNAGSLVEVIDLDDLQELIEFLSIVAGR